MQNELSSRLIKNLQKKMKLRLIQILKLFALIHLFFQTALKKTLFFKLEKF